jgi:DNA-directed RNA polymerase specialized sigma24 family protein
MSQSRSALQRMKDNKAKLDAEAAERDRVELQVIKSYAATLVDLDKVERAWSRTQDKLAQQKAKAEREYEQARAEVRDRQAQVLAELHSAGRSAEEIATLTELPVKRVRAMLRTATPNNARATSAAVTASTESASAGPTDAVSAVSGTGASA